jgi:hypothetical protein
MENTKLPTEVKAEYIKLQRQVQEASAKLFDRGNGGRIKGKSPNLFNNRLERIQEFCRQNNLTNSRWLRINKLTI